MNYKAVNAGFCEKMKVTCVPPGRPSLTTGWEPLLYTNKTSKSDKKFHHFC